MASLPSLGNPITISTPSSSSRRPFFQKLSQLSSTTYRLHKVVCSAENGSTRRNVLLSLGGLYGVAELNATGTDRLAFGAPITPPKAVKDLVEKAKKKIKGEFPKTLDETITVIVPRPKKSRSKKEKDDEEEILVIKDIELDRDTVVKFDVFIDAEDLLNPQTREFAGSFVNVPHKHRKKKLKTDLNLGITDLLEDLDAEDDDVMVVTIVPRQGTVTIGAIKIMFGS